MKIYPDKLAAHLAQHQDLLYLVSGEEILLANEAGDAIRQAAQKRGYLEREAHDAELPGFAWEDVLQSINSLSLFASKKLVEIRCPRKHLSNELFLDYWSNPNPDTVILLFTDKLDKAAQNSKWFRTLDDAGVFLQVWPLETDAFRRWLAQRAQQHKLILDSQALTILQERTEGNLLAAVQELEKLHLQFGESAISAETLESAVADNSRHTVFSLSEHIWAGHTAEALKIFHALMEEGGIEFPLLRNWIRELHLLAEARDAVDKGQSASASLQRQGVWDKRQAPYLSALKRLDRQKIESALQMTQRIDLLCMGLQKGNVRDELETLCLWLSGKTAVHAAIKRSG